MPRKLSKTYEYLVLDVAEIKGFINLWEEGRIPEDLVQEKIDEKIQKVIDIKFKMARGSDVTRREEKEVQALFKRLVLIKDGLTFHHFVIQEFRKMLEMVETLNERINQLVAHHP